jgi:hypothetical protein
MGGGEAVEIEEEHKEADAETEVESDHPALAPSTGTSVGNRIDKLQPNGPSPSSRIIVFETALWVMKVLLSEPGSTRTGHKFPVQMSIADTASDFARQTGKAGRCNGGTN